MHCLDLNNWTWARIKPGGPPPSRTHCSGLTSWLHKGKMYHYVDEGLFCYNVSKNIWEWPRLRGEIPPVYDKCLSIIHEDTVFLSMRGNLHILDMETMVWSKVHGEEYINFTRWYSVTITKVSQSTATLIGESGDLMTCWLLDLKKAKQFM